MSEASNQMQIDNQLNVIIEYAVGYAAKKMGLEDNEKAIDKLRRFDRLTHNYFRYAVAKKTIGFLKTSDQFVLDGYLIDETEEEIEIPHSEPLYMIILAKRKTAALRSIIDALTSGLLAKYKHLMGDSAKDLRVFTFCELIDEQGFKLKQKLFGSYSSPIKLDDSV